MKIGIIVIFNNNDSDIKVSTISANFKSAQEMVFCLVDNQSSDKTLEKLEELRWKSSNVEVVQIKKQSSQETAKRAGARFMFNNYNLKHIGYIDVNTVKTNDLDINKVIKLICNGKSAIGDYNTNLKTQQQRRYTLFKSIFSALDFVKNYYSKCVNDKAYQLIK